jgi:molybdopterin molybdotransferase
MSEKPSPKGMMSLQEALALILAQGERHAINEVQTVPTMQALGRVLAQDVVSPIQVPPADNTSMDGYALRAADVAEAGTVLEVSQRIPAGHPGQRLKPGTAARIFTGAFVPEGADTVVMQEHCEVLAEGAAQGLHKVRVNVPPTRGQWIRRAGEDVRLGDKVLHAGQTITAQAMGLAAGVGRAELVVRRRVRVGLMSTGDELVMPGEVAPEAMPLGSIYNSNRFMLAGLLRERGCEVQDFGVIPDRLDATQQVLRQAASSCDLVISSGGVSVGEEDHVKAAVQSLGTLSLWQLSIKPGKPLALGSIDRSAPQACLFLGLPGNPVSSFVTFLLAAMPLIAAMSGQRHEPRPISMRADFDWTKPDMKRDEYLRVRRNAQGGLDLFGNQSSGVLTSVVWADGLAGLVAGQRVSQGDMLNFWPWSSFGLSAQP